jgi:hypothetical protein
MSAWGQKSVSLDVSKCLPLCPLKAVVAVDIGGWLTYAPQQIVSLFDHRVGALVQKPRHLKTECLRCFEREKSPQRRR